MKCTYLSCCTLFLLTSSFAFAQTPATGDPATEATLQKMEMELAKADTAHDTAPFEKYLDDNIVALGPGWHSNGKAETLAGIKSSPCTSSDATLSGFSYRWLSADMVLMSYMENYTSTCQGKARPTAERDSSLWQKKNGRWVAVFHQATTEEPTNTSGGL
jgi:hypothetical protein